MDAPLTSKVSLKPKSLYYTSIDAIACRYNILHTEFYIFPAKIYFDILYGLYCNELWFELTIELSHLEKFTKALKASSKHLEFHKCFQAIMDFSFQTNTTKPSAILAEAFIKKNTDQRTDQLTERCTEQLITQGLSLSAFLSDAGWLEEAATVLKECCTILKESQHVMGRLKLLECYQRLLHVQTEYCQFKAAEKTFYEAIDLASQLQSSGYRADVALLYSEVSTLFMLRSDYTMAYHWSVKSLHALIPSLPPASLVDVLRQASKACVLKRDFKKAGLLIRQAFQIAKSLPRDQSLKYADTLIDFGFYLLNVDAIRQGIEVYQTALCVRQSVFGLKARNLHVAFAHEDVSYASYVFNYSNGLFEEARNQAEKAISLLLVLLPRDHLLLSSCKRVKALILEEMAIENPDKDIEAKYLDEAHTLHNEALQLALESFGEMNVQTAKHYGNLGRLYQSMKRFKRAEEMHVKAIRIKEALLGPDDYDVALSVGHLASLYNYDLGHYNKAESLYLRSIHIGKKLFGEAYSGLEYDYQGLLRVYTQQYDMEKRLHYRNILDCWRLMREKKEQDATSPFTDLKEPLDVNITIQQFMAL